MTTAKKLTLVGCTLILGYALIKWLTSPRLVEVNLPLSESLPDGDYIVGFSDSSKRVRIMNGKVYAVTISATKHKRTAQKKLAELHNSDYWSEKIV